MGFIQRAFTPPGAGSNPPGSPLNPLPGAVAAAAPPPPAPTPAPPPPILPTAPAPPQLFQPTQTPQTAQRAAVTGTSILGAAATAGQTAKKSLLGA